MEWMGNVRCCKVNPYEQLLFIRLRYDSAPEFFLQVLERNHQQCPVELKLASSAAVVLRRRLHRVSKVLPAHFASPCTIYFHLLCLRFCFCGFVCGSEVPNCRFSPEHRLDRKISADGRHLWFCVCLRYHVDFICLRCPLRHWRNVRFHVRCVTTLCVISGCSAPFSSRRVV